MDKGGLKVDFILLGVAEIYPCPPKSVHEIGKGICPRRRNRLDMLHANTPSFFNKLPQSNTTTQ